MNIKTILLSLFVVFLGSCSDSTDPVDPRNISCPDGQWNFNGICVPGCLANNDCARDQYCSIDEFIGSGICVNETVPVCTSNNQCSDNQVCRGGFCATPDPNPEPNGCQWMPNQEDGCDEFSICYVEEDQTTGTCYAFPPCPRNGVCPVGLNGAVCNENDIPTKARICMSGVCKSDENCPDQFTCNRSLGGNLGFCFPDLGGFPGGDQFSDPFASCEDAGGVCEDLFDGCPAGRTEGVQSCPDFLNEVCCQ